MPRRQPVRRLVEVVWRDAAFDLDIKTELCTMHTVGWLMEETDAKIVLAGERDMDDDYHRSYTAIPKECIIVMHDLTRRRARTK